ncbi:RPM1 interacting protein 13-like [Tasmannia lanceolata]|uniref:RPM1 interacting protein 13-like n=1 Tax=Tasmannia lanceolata TaxID=3420 RepID=UPI004062B426
MAGGVVTVIEIFSSDDESSPIKSWFSKFEKNKIKDEDCFILDFDPFQKIDPSLKMLALHDDDEDLTVISERGQVACRDYPHSRHLCVKFPFSQTPHDSYCPQCYCYVCDTAAPCIDWKKFPIEHCHATDKDPKWKQLRRNKTGRSELQTTLHTNR